MIDEPKHIMNNQTESWIAPDFVEISACMECTAYSETLD